MKLRTFEIVAVILACLLVSGPAQAQFGKLKSLAKDKLNMDGAGSEVKATYAPGVKKGKSLEVARQSAGTPEANSASRKNSSAPQAEIAAIENGRSQEVVIKASHVDARQLDGVQGYKPCTKLANFVILSATQMKVTIDLTGNNSAGTCSLSFRSDGKTVFSTNVSIKAKK
jgi:hypothetical protein